MSAAATTVGAGVTTTPAAALPPLAAPAPAPGPAAAQGILSTGESIQEYIDALPPIPNKAEFEVFVRANDLGKIDAFRKALESTVDKTFQALANCPLRGDSYGNFYREVDQRIAGLMDLGGECFGYGYFYELFATRITKSPVYWGQRSPARMDAAQPDAAAAAAFIVAHPLADPNPNPPAPQGQAERAAPAAPAAGPASATSGASPMALAVSGPLAYANPNSPPPMVNAGPAGSRAPSAGPAAAQGSRPSDHTPNHPPGEGRSGKPSSDAPAAEPLKLQTLPLLLHDLANSLSLLAGSVSEHLETLGGRAPSKEQKDMLSGLSARASTLVRRAEGCFSGLSSQQKTQFDSVIAKIRTQAALTSRDISEYLNARPVNRAAPAAAPAPGPAAAGPAPILALNLMAQFRAAHEPAAAAAEEVTEEEAKRKEAILKRLQSKGQLHFAFGGTPTGKK